MAERTDYKALQRLSAARWENDRAARGDRLAEALAGTRAAGRALPGGVTSGLVDLGRAAEELRSELRGQLTATNPFVAVAPGVRLRPRGRQLDRRADRL